MFMLMLKEGARGALMEDIQGGPVRGVGFVRTRKGVAYRK